MTDSVIPTKQPDLTIVIPAYSEEKRISSTLEQLAEFLRRDTYFKHKDVEVIVVAADARDRTREIVTSFQKQFKHFVFLKPGPRVGKGRDVQHGMLRAHGMAVIYMDADLATPLSHLKQFYMSFKQGNDVIIATRNLSTYRSSRMRNLFSRFGNALYQAAGGVRVEDTQCGFKLFSYQAAQLCFTKLTILGWGFDLEVLAIAITNGLTIQAYRIDDWEDKPFSTYTDGVIRIMLRSVRDFTRVQINKVRRQYIDH